jgi:hypothetical protein
MALRKGFRLRIGRRNRTRSRLDEVTEQTREESRALARERRMEARRRRLEARQRIRDEGARLEELGVRLRGALFETRRRLRPVFAPFAALLDRVAPYVTRTLLFLVQLVAAFIALVLAVGQTALRWLVGKANDGAIAASIALERTVTPLRTVAFVGAAAAVALGVSQFFDYHGVAVDAPDYAGEIGAVAALTSGSCSLSPPPRWCWSPPPPAGGPGRRPESQSAGCWASPSRSRSIFHRDCRSGVQDSPSRARTPSCCRDSGPKSPRPQCSSFAGACWPSTLVG